jgi:hypothetical protein
MRSSPSIVRTVFFTLVLALLCYPGKIYGAVGTSLPFTEYEAEAGVLGGGATVVSLQFPLTGYTDIMEASGHAYVSLAATGQSVKWTNNTGQSITAINARISIPDSATGGGISSTIDLYVNGTLRQAIPVSSLQTWSYDYGNDSNPGDENPADGTPYLVWDEYHFFVTGAAIAPGSTIMLQKDAANSAAFYNIDCIDLETPPAALTQPANSLSITSSPYNAVANNSSVDNRAAIQDCINDAQTQGKIVWIPQGTFYMLGDGVSATGITMEGAGIWYSTLFLNLTANGTALVVGGTSCTFQNFAVNSNAYGYGDGPFGFGMGGDNWTINNCWVTHMGLGIGCAGSEGTIENTRVTNTWADGINFSNGGTGANSTGSNEIITNNFLRGNFADVIAFGGYEEPDTTPCSGFTVTNNTLMTGPLHPYGGRNILIQNNYIHDSGSPGLWIGNFVQDASLLNTLIQGNLVTRCGGNAGQAIAGAQVGTANFTYNDTDNNIVPYVADGIIVRSNVITDSLFDGLSIAICSNLLVEGNTIANSGGRGITISSGNSGTGTFVNNLVNNTATGAPNIFDDAGAPPNTFDTPATELSLPVSQVTLYLPQEPANTINALLADNIVPIEASSSNSVSGTSLETCVEGGQDVSGIASGSYTEYNNINLSGATAFSARVACGGLYNTYPGVGGTINIHLDSATGTVIGTCPVTSTNALGWQSWTTVSCPVSGATGFHNVYLVYTGGSGYLFNVEWFGFLISADTIEASSYNNMSNIQTENSSEGGLDVNNTATGSYTEYNNVDLNNGRIFTARTASTSSGGTIAIYLDSATGTLIGTCPVANTGGSQTYNTQSCVLSPGIFGYHNVYLVYSGAFKVKSFSFDGGLNGTEASSYNSENSVGTETCVEGGLDVEGITNGSYTVYNNVNLNGATSFQARVASDTSGGTINIHLDSATGTVIGTAAVAGTGGWQTWTTVSCNLSGASGYHNVYLVYTGSSGYLFNVEWFGFQGSNSDTPVASYNSLSGSLYLQGDSEGGQNMANIANGNYIVYNNVNLTPGGASGFRARMASATSGGTLALHLDSATGTLIGSCTVGSTGGWQNWVTETCALSSSATGIHNIYMVASGGGGTLFNLESFEFMSAITPIGAASYSSLNPGTGMYLQGCSEGGENLANIGNGDYAVYNNINLNGKTVFTARSASAGGGGTIVIHLDSPTGTVIGTCTTPGTGNWQVYSNSTCTLTGASGTHNLYLVFTTGGFNLEWFMVQ